MAEHIKGSTSPFLLLDYFIVSCHKEIQEDVSSVDCVWQCLLLSQESEAWWINCQLWRMIFSPYFHYEPSCHLLINFLHWYQFIFTSRGSDVFGKGSDSPSGPARQSWLHLILGNYFGSKDRTWPVALENKKLCERKRTYEASSFFEAKINQACRIAMTGYYF